MAQSFTTPSELAALYRDFLVDVWEDGYLDLLEEFVADAYVEHDPLFDHDVRGPAAYRGTVERFRAAFPDLEVDVQDVAVADDRVVARFVLRGTFDGAFLGAPPTGQSFEVECIDIVRFSGGQLVELWRQLDTLGFVDQLGLEPPVRSDD